MSTNKKIGKFLKELRTKKGKKIKDLITHLEEDNFNVTYSTIRKWENGDTLPEINKLLSLAEFYDVSIDTILNCEKCEEINFDAKYYIHNDLWTQVKHIKNNEIFDTFLSQSILIRKNFKKLIYKYFLDKIKNFELNELKFLLKHYCSGNPDENLIYLTFLKNKRMSLDNKWWNVQNNISFIVINTPTIYLQEDTYSMALVNEYYDLIEDWEKDVMLSSIQTISPIITIDSDVKRIDQYEEKYNKKFIKEEVIKEHIKCLINHGAVLNPVYFGYYKKNVERKDIRYETLEYYENYIKPYEIKKENLIEFYLVENTPKNNFIINYKYVLQDEMEKLGYDIDEAYELISKNEDIPDEIYFKYAELYQINQKDIKKLKPLVAFYMQTFDYHWKKYHKEEKNRKNFKKQYEINLDLISKGNFYSEEITRKFIGGCLACDRYEYAKELNTQISYKESRAQRNTQLTNELVFNIDKLTFDEIQKKYFRTEER